MMKITKKKLKALFSTNQINYYSLFYFCLYFGY